jgi:flagellar motility protein MotE (MotC chaperone)
MKSLGWMSLVLGMAVVITLTGLNGQEKGAPKKDEPAKTKEEPKTKDTAKAKGQLPTYWGQLGLSEEQKQKVYKLQGKYNDEIDKLELQIKELKAKMSEERGKILTGEQKKRLEEIIKTKAGADK